MTAPVVVDPAPPDLATGLEALAAAARSGSGQLVLVAADLTVHAEALADLADDPRPGNGRPRQQRRRGGTGPAGPRRPGAGGSRRRRTR